jgi:hypothetical protein
MANKKNDKPMDTKVDSIDTNPIVQAVPTQTPDNGLTKGLILILASSLLLSFQNVVTRVILSPKSLFGFFDGVVLSKSYANSLLILVLRCLVVLPIMAFIVAPRIYKNTWSDIKSLPNPENSTRLKSVVCTLHLAPFQLELQQPSFLFIQQ